MLEFLGPAFLVILVVLALLLIIRNIRVVQQANAYVIERLGAYSATWEVGLHIKIPFIERVAKVVSLKEQVADFLPQPVITKDNVTMQIDTVVYFQITDPKLFTYGVEQPMLAIENLSATTLRNIIGDLDLDQCLTSRDIINSKMRVILDEATDPWGIKVHRVELKNIVPPFSGPRVRSAPPFWRPKARRNPPFCGPTPKSSSRSWKPKARRKPSSPSSGPPPRASGSSTSPCPARPSLKSRLWRPLPPPPTVRQRKSSSPPRFKVSQALRKVWSKQSRSKPGRIPRIHPRIVPTVRGFFERKRYGYCQRISAPAPNVPHFRLL